MINIYMKNVTSKLEGDLSLVKKDLIKILSYTKKSFNSKDKIEYLFNPSNQITYTGLIPTVIDILYKKGIKYQIHDLREKPKQNANFNINKNWKPRDYQQKIIDNVSSRECIQAATGAGKTFIMANLIAKFNVKPVVIIAPKISLVTQIQQEMTKFLNIKVDAYYSGINLPDNYIPNVIVSTSSIPINILKQSKMLIWDEFHNAASSELFDTGINSNAYYKFGFSATPWRDDGKDILLEALTNKRKPKNSISASMLIKKKVLVPCTINFIKINNIFSWNGNYNELYQNAIVNNNYRNQIIINKTIEMLNKNRKVLIIIKNIAHGKKLYDMLISKLNNPNKIKFIYGDTDINERNKIFNDVKQNKIDILIGSTIADEGLDCPPLDCLILAGEGKSSTKAFQRIGRVLRLAPNKKDAIVFDFEDMTPILHKHYETRKKLYGTESEWKITWIK